MKGNVIGNRSIDFLSGLQLALKPLELVGFDFSYPTGCVEDAYIDSSSTFAQASDQATTNFKQKWPKNKQQALQDGPLTVVKVENGPDVDISPGLKIYSLDPSKYPKPVAAGSWKAQNKQIAQVAPQQPAETDSNRTVEINHVPSDCFNKKFTQFKREEGVAIAMLREDHAKTLTFNKPWPTQQVFYDESWVDLYIAACQASDVELAKEIYIDVFQQAEYDAIDLLPIPTDRQESYKRLITGARTYTRSLNADLFCCIPGTSTGTGSNKRKCQIPPPSSATTPTPFPT